jgi:hypothetical protein
MVEVDRYAFLATETPKEEERLTYTCTDTDKTPNAEHRTLLQQLKLKSNTHSNIVI